MKEGLMFSFLKSIIDEYPMFAGMVGAGSVTYTMYALRKIPVVVYMFFSRLFSVELVVNSVDQTVYETIQEWIIKNNPIDKIHSYKLDLNDRGIGSAGSITTGIGYSVFVFRYKLAILNVKKSNIDWGASKKIDQIKITAFGIGARKSINDCLSSLESIKVDINSLTTKTFDGYRWISKYKDKRSIDTLYTPNNIKQSILSDISTFVDSKEWYMNSGIPHKRGYLLYGPPGTGKTTIISCIASELNMPIHLINLASMRGDSELISAIRCCSRNSMVVFEDIDCMGNSSHTRDGDDTPDNPTPDIGITMSGLLNALDGIETPDGIVFVLTTNHPDRLDPAIIRPGRVDMKIEMEKLSREHATEMASMFPEIEIDLDSFEYPVSPAELQGQAILKYYESRRQTT